MSTGNLLMSSSARSSSLILEMIKENIGPTSSIVVNDCNLPTDLISIQDRKDEVLQVLKSDLMASLNKEVKSLDEDN
ncbi:hypothetical protein CQW23_19540 [Capsicum baccatum]|uniref:Uncharacterized protein n=1 Tax=Capsicum baccatum TaxID=33114 RepID=A0A2G2W637_CAPBA|nr:hypothetical protein CQW23_19540 [Capsicum baccatum]